jgi:hypothetical protein
LGRFIEDAIGSKGILGAGGSVATSAFDAACLLRHDKTLPVFIAGLDLSYPALKTHYKGAHFEERALNIQYRFHPAEYETFSALHSAAPFWTEDRAGGKVLTDKRLGLYARWFEYKFSEQKNLPFYELSPHGRAIPGLKTASIDAIYAHPVCRKEIDLCKEKIFTALDAAWTRHEAKTARAERFNTAQLLLINSLKEIRAAAEKSARLAQKALSENCSSAETAQIYKLFEITNQLAENSPVKNIIQFLSPDSTIPKAPPNNYPDDLIEFHRYLKSSLEIYDQLAEIADFHIKAII